MNRIAELRKEQNLSQKELGKILGVAQNTICNWENGKREPDYASVEKMIKHFSCTVEYLLGMRDSIDSPPDTGGTVIPVLGDVAAGIPIEAITDIVDYEEIDSAMARNGDYFGLRIKGASMEPRMREGDVVIVRKQETADTGDTVVVLVNGDSATVKRIKYGADGITLISTNPSYDPMFFSASEVEGLPVRVIGKVVELRAKF